VSLELAKQRTRARRAGLVGMVSGVLGSAAFMVLLEHTATPPPSVDDGQMVAFDAPEKSTPPPAPRPKPKPKPKKRSKAPPTPSLGAGLAGLSFGIPGLSGVLDDTTDALLGEVGDVVMTEDAVDVVPRAMQRVPAEYPSRARQQGITGYVTLSLLVGSDGSVSDVRVLESQPTGVFDAVALSAVRGWRFQPAMYEGRPVSVRARQTLRFELE